MVIFMMLKTYCRLSERLHWTFVVCCWLAAQLPLQFRQNAAARILTRKVWHKLHRLPITIIKWKFYLSEKSLLVIFKALMNSSVPTFLAGLLKQCNTSLAFHLTDVEVIVVRGLNVEQFRATKWREACRGPEKHVPTLTVMNILMLSTI